MWFVFRAPLQWCSSRRAHQRRDPRRPFVPVGSARAVGRVPPLSCRAAPSPSWPLPYFGHFLASVQVKGRVHLDSYDLDANRGVLGDVAVGVSVQIVAAGQASIHLGAVQQVARERRAAGSGRDRGWPMASKAKDRPRRRSPAVRTRRSHRECWRTTWRQHHRYRVSWGTMASFRGRLVVGRRRLWFGVRSGAIVASGHRHRLSWVLISKAVPVSFPRGAFQVAQAEGICRALGSEPQIGGDRRAGASAVQIRSEDADQRPDVSLQDALFGPSGPRERLASKQAIRRCRRPGGGQITKRR